MTAAKHPNKPTCDFVFSPKIKLFCADGFLVNDRYESAALHSSFIVALRGQFAGLANDSLAGWLRRRGRSYSISHQNCPIHPFQQLAHQFNRFG